MAAPRVRLSRDPESINGQAERTVFQDFGMTRPGIERSLPAFVARAQPTHEKMKTKLLCV